MHLFSLTCTCNTCTIAIQVRGIILAKSTLLLENKNIPTISDADLQTCQFVDHLNDSICK